MSKQCLDVQQMQHLQEMGLDTSNASMYWISYNGISVSIPSNFHLPTSNNDYVICDAYTLQDVLDALPKCVSKDGCTWAASLYIDFENDRIAYGNTDRYGFEVYHEIMIEKDLIDAAYSMLCWAIENKFVETNKNE
ncbi:MAG TPA: hypothetical protein IAA99_03755 [Candidatus Avibacteroides faecavium]|nr:hypothetical protein [Candidatus Avibacteroides faecavium]